jgi:membrane protein implicated in regulation of membrane protease activity
MSWWAWMILGAFLAGAELFAIDAQFFLIFLGLSAGIVGLLAAGGIVNPEWAQWLTFATLSLVSMFTFRKAIYMNIRGGVPGFNEGVAGQHLLVPDDLGPGEQGRASHRGTDWTVVNSSEVSIAAGTRAKIVRSEGLTLHVSGDSTE